jgi:hypothetical protein
VQVLEQCREVYADRQQRVGADEAGAAAAQPAAAAAALAKGGKAPTAKDIAFRAAVNACRKRGGGGALATPSKPVASRGPASPA